MFCIKCGAKLEEGNKFCINCGNSVLEQNNKVQNIRNESTNVSAPTGDSNKGLASLIIGIITIFLPILPLSILGLILGIKEQNKDGKRVAGIILNIISLILSLITAIIVILAFYIAFNTSTYDYDDDDEDDYDYYDYYDYDDQYNYYNEAKEQVVGNDTYGYLILSKDWYKFVDVDGNTSIQYSYLNKYIVSLNVVTADVTLVEASTNMEENIKREASTATKKGTMIGSYPGYVINSKYPDGTYLDAYLFEAEDNKIHYIAIEGPDNTSEYFKIPNTFTLTEPIASSYK